MLLESLRAKVCHARQLVSFILSNKGFNSMRYITIISVFLALAPLTVAAEDRWVTDEFEVMLRSGKSTRQSIVRQLKSGTQVELLEADSETGYTRVRLLSGTEGWVLTRYLRRSPTAQLRLPAIESELQASEVRQAELSAEVSDLRQARDTLESEIDDLQSRNASLQEQLDRVTTLSADTIQVDQRNRQIAQRLAETEQQVDALRIENGQLASRANREWFLVGGIVAVVGILLGLILPRIRWRKKSSWSDF